MKLTSITLFIVILEYYSGDPMLLHN